MKRILIICNVLAISLISVAQTTQQRYEAYIKQYVKIAQEQMRMHKIPASITLAQGLLESGAGSSDLATKANNHFGIKCAGNWTGETFTKDDDTKDECFRKYKRAEDSYEDHSQFLLRSRYESLFALALTDYKGWARGLKTCGYATDPGYAAKLIKIIEDYNLMQYDNIQQHTSKPKAESKPKATEPKPTEPKTKAHKTTPAKQSETKEDSVTVKQSTHKVNKDLPVVDLYPIRDIKHQNGSRYIIAQEGDTFERIAYEYNIDEKTLRHYNDILNPNYELQAGDRVYLQLKRKKAAAKHARYFVHKDENIWQVAQNTGMRLKTIYSLNGIEEGQNVTINQELRLR